MRHEFDVELRSAVARPKPATKPRLPPIRRTLVLAYQIADSMKGNGISSLKAFCRRAGITSARGSQIMALLNLSPAIQAEILLGDRRPLLKIAERQIRHIVQEALWTRQEELWRALMMRQGSRCLGARFGLLPSTMPKPPQLLSASMRC